MPVQVRAGAADGMAEGVNVGRAACGAVSRTHRCGLGPPLMSAACVSCPPAAPPPSQPMLPGAGTARPTVSQGIIVYRGAYFGLYDTAKGVLFRVSAVE